MRIEFIANASVLITLDSGWSLLTDPWYSDGAFYGSWFNFPPLTEEQRRRYLGLRPSCIYISHVHPDHLDPETLAQYPPDTPILVGKLPQDHLHRALRRLGFSSVRELDLDRPVDVDGARLTILGQYRGSRDGYDDATGYAIDTSLYLQEGDHGLFHAVDNPLKVGDAKRLVAEFGRPDVAILPYSGASFFPHGFRAYGPAEKQLKAQALKARCLDHLAQLAEAIRARWVIPAAGSYVMGGRIAGYSRYLHQATPAELLARWTGCKPGGSELCVLCAGDVLDATAGSVERSATARFRDFTEADRTAYALSLEDRPLPQDRVAIPGAFALPWPRLLRKARSTQWAMQEKLSLYPAVDIELRIRATPEVSTGADDPLIFPFSLDGEPPEAEGTANARSERARVRFHVDASILLMTLLGGAVWNNLEIGALVECERSPDVHDPTVHSLMSYFHL